MAKLLKGKILHILSASRAVTARHNLKFLIEHTLNASAFNTLNHKIDSDNYIPRAVLQEWFVSWESFQGKNATLKNLAKVLQEMDCNLEAGKYTNE